MTRSSSPRRPWSAGRNARADARQGRRFRNVLVRDYIAVNDEIVVARLNALDDLDEFVRQIAAYVSAAGA
ncbi:HepT-like ribonuclease domain-containing protein [Candidatus Protofrankia datiscae]|uniref:HepT-like ribonuclease domain-containing protein n=1 Tax=Protofrankia TaxID=2994361 RepID=UPI003D66CF32